MPKVANLREIRERRLMTQADLAKQVGITQPNLSRIESGLVAPRFGTIRRLAEVLDVDPDQLIRWGGDSDEGLDIAKPAA